jgi:hypothetical protein
MTYLQEFYRSTFRSLGVRGNIGRAVVGLSLSGDIKFMEFMHGHFSLKRQVYSPFGGWVLSSLRQLAGCSYPYCVIFFCFTHITESADCLSSLSLLVCHPFSTFSLLSQWHCLDSIDLSLRLLTFFYWLLSSSGRQPSILSSPSLSLPVFWSQDL